MKKLHYYSHVFAIVTGELVELLWIFCRIRKQNFKTVFHLETGWQICKEPDFPINFSLSISVQLLSSVFLVPDLSFVMASAGKLQSFYLNSTFGIFHSLWFRVQIFLQLKAGLWTFQMKQLLNALLHPHIVTSVYYLHSKRILIFSLSTWLAQIIWHKLSTLFKILQ